MSSRKNWSLEDLKAGIDRFYQENDRYPTVSDLDTTNYLPSARWIQIKFGGMVKVRSDLGYEDSHLGSGKYRTEIASQVNKIGLEFEHEIEKFLVNKFGEPFVHIQKRVGNERNRIDFFVYNATQNFGVDVTSVSGHFRNLQINVNVKISKYKDLGFELYIVVQGDYDQLKIDQWLLKKAKLLPSNWKVLTVTNFMKLVSKLRPYSVLS